MNKEKRGILYGMLLGDGNLYKQYKNSRLTIGHSPKQREYLEHKIDLIHSIFGGKRPVISEYQSLNKKMDKVYTNIQAGKTDKYLNQVHRVLYPKGVKIFTRKVLDYLTDHGLALWFCDDGSGTTCRNKQKKICGCMIRIATYCSLEEVNIIKQWFEDTYKISPRFDLDKRNNKYSLRFGTKDSHTFIKIVQPFVPDCMGYKLDIIQERRPPQVGEDIV